MLWRIVRALWRRFVLGHLPDEHPLRVPLPENPIKPARVDAESGGGRTVLMPRYYAQMGNWS